MKVLTISDVRKNLAAVVDAVIDDAEERIIPRGGGKAVVIVSLDEWNAMNETLPGWPFRRVNDEHRLIYRVRGGDLEIAACHGHYLDK